MKLSFAKMWNAFEETCFGESCSIAAYINKENGDVFIAHDLDDDLNDDNPEDLFENDIYFSLPYPTELTSGRELALQFASAEVRDHADEIYEIFEKRGAFSRFKHLLAHIGKLEDWYTFEQETQKKELREWFEVNEIDIDYEN